MSFLVPQRDAAEPVTGIAYLTKLHKYLQVNAGRLSPSGPSKSAPTALQQTYTLLTLGLDPSSAPLSRSLKVPLTLGFGTPAQPRTPNRPVRPLLLRLPPDRLLYLLLKWQSLPQSLPHVGRTDVPIEPGVPVAARGARADERASGGGVEGDVRSVRSWVGSMRSVSMGSLVGKERGRGWWGKKEEVNEDQILLALYSMFTLLPALLIHPPFVSEPPILDLIEAGGYTALGGIDVRVPLDVLRNLSILELEGYDPRALLIPPNVNMRSLTVRDVQDGDDWIEELLTVEAPRQSAGQGIEQDQADDEPAARPRFPNLRHLSLVRTTLLSLPPLPLSSLTHLDLSHNLLNSLPSSLGSLTSLISLNLSNNVITSLRGAAAYLPSLVSLNLSSNRIDCLVGLDGVLTLERVDVRNNELLEAGEVGRLAVLPQIKEVWCAGNGFDIGGEDEWRVELGAAFRQEGREVRLDDVEFTWNENRRIEGILNSRGRHAGHSHSRAGTWQSTHSHGQSHGAEVRSTPSTLGYGSSGLNAGERGGRDQPDGPHSDARSRQGSTRSQAGFPAATGATASASASASPTTGTPRQVAASPASFAAVAKKKGRRRVIDLDGTDGGDVPQTHQSMKMAMDSSLRGSVRLPDRVDEGDEGDEGASATAPTSDPKDVPVPTLVLHHGAANGRGNGETAGVPEVQVSSPVAEPADVGHVPSPSDVELPAAAPIPSVKVVSSKRRGGRKALAKDTFDPVS
ncbi:hypothetical protein IAU60_003868 [Kwoniella sp. DSM 27419]